MNSITVRSVLVTTVILLAPFFVSPAEGQRAPSDEWLIASAVLAAPEAFRATAEVRKWTDQGELATIRAGAGLICIADQPGDTTFRAACYHEALEPFMERGRQLTAAGVEGMARHEARWEDVREGRLAMPDGVAMVYNLTFPSESFDPATTDPATGGRLQAVYRAFMTSESTGLPTTPDGGGPWLMWPGEASSHIMVQIPPRGGG